MWRVVIVLIAFSATVKASPLARPGLFLDEADVTVEGQVVKIEFEVPCGSTFWGLMAREVDVGKGRHLQLGVVLAQRPITCTGGSENYEVRSNLFSVGSYLGISSMEVESPKAISMGKVLKVRREKKDIYGTVDRTCAPILGTLMKVKGSGSDKVLVVGSAYPSRLPRTMKKNCVSVQKNLASKTLQRRLVAVTPEAAKKIRPYGTSAAEIYRR